MSSLQSSSLRLYNTLTKKEEVFVPIQPGKVLMYTCGPTVYGRPHIGNYSAYLMADLLRRWLEASGYEVFLAKNITDVGHLLHDADQGDDKIETQAKKEKLDPLAIASKYESQFLEDEQALHILEPFARPRATETVPEMIAIIRSLLEKGYAYETSDGIYFAVEKFRSYGALSGNTIEKLSAGARIEVNEAKKHPADFALWKKCVGENSPHLLRWSYATGERVHSDGEDASAGFPGWHIECSAMSRKFLGPQIDIHTGGEDNIFPHHECEIAQSESSCDLHPFVKYWVHRRWIQIGEEKMSKSLGNVFTLPDIIEKGFSPMDLRYYLLSVHYRTNLKFTWKGLDDARKARQKIVEWMTAVESIKPVATAHSHAIENTVQHFKNSMNSDLNTSAALADIFAAMNFFYAHTDVSAEDLEGYRVFIDLIRRTFGCFDPERAEAIPVAVQELVDARAVARSQKNFSESDRLRDALMQRGYEVKDTSEGQSVRKL